MSTKNQLTKSDVATTAHMNDAVLSIARLIKVSRTVGTCVSNCI